jgi:hypothetical protein
MKIIQTFTLAVASALLVACGGGGGSGGGTTVSNLSFNVQAALRTLAIAGQNATFTVSGDCSGTGTYTASPATTSTTFEAKSAFSSVAVLVINLSNCTPAVISSTATNYYDTNYLPLGASGDRYLVYTGSLNIPTAAKVGDAGIAGNLLRYTNSSKTVPDGSGQLSYVVEADTETTAILTVVTKVYANSSALESTQLTKYRVNSSNVLSLLSLTIQNASGVNLVLTKQ